MKTQSFVLLLLSVLLFSACQAKKQNIEITKSNSKTVNKNTATIPFVMAQNYFVKNTVVSIPNPKIETKAEFDSYFGAATTMSENGKPTTIDFSKQYVITIVLPNTDMEASILPLSLMKVNDTSMVFEYKTTIGGKLSYTIRPFLLALVDKKFDGKVRLKSIE